MKINHNELDSDLENLKNKIDKLDSKDSEIRLYQINSRLDKKELDIDSLTSSELDYVHARLHMLFHQKNPSIPHQFIENYHHLVKNRLKTHNFFDRLDE